MRKILFLTGTRADFGKLKPLIRVIHDCGEFDYAIFVTGMHVLSRYGYTVDEVHKAGFRNIFSYMNHNDGEPMDGILASTIHGLSRYVRENRPDMLVVHGDRVETLAGAIVGALNNIHVVHVEGGEVSGTIDELIRHAVSKLSHIHFVANEEASTILQQMGENADSIFVIGSPDIDAMLSDTLPTLQEVKARYEIPFDQYAIVLYHPVTTELSALTEQTKEFVASLLESKQNFVVIYPNNDTGSERIFEAYEGLKGHSRFRIVPSLRFEYFLTLLKHAQFILGNSSAGIREAPVYAIPTVNVGSRQKNRYRAQSIINVTADRLEILSAMREATAMVRPPASLHFGTGDSAKRFLTTLRGDRLWAVSHQKQFNIIIPNKSEQK
jgi:UDP-N-acetylglucosamine 2-epimerase (hydrolysing)